MLKCRVSSVLMFSVFLFTTQIASANQNDDCTDVARDDVPLLVFSTLGGGLTAVDPITSEVRWNMDDDPAIRAPAQSENISPYLPDPRDGSLYQLGDMGGLKKMPFTIPELVASAPCRSSDGILYSGKKKDTWFLIDPKTGRREKVVGFGADSKDSIGWATSRAVYLGRTQYTVLMYDSTTKDKNTKPWNVTFFDYSSHSMAPEVTSEYEFLHLSGSGSGMIVTLDRAKGTFLWQKDLKSPVIAAFLLGPDGLLSVPFTTVSDETLKSIVDYARDGQQNDIKLFQSLYVGEHNHGLYALPALIDRGTKTISADPPIKLIEGPDASAARNPDLVYLNTILENSNNNKNKNVVVLGHYQMPKVNEEIEISISPPKYLQQSGRPLPNHKPDDPNDSELVVKSPEGPEYEVLNLNKVGGSKGNVIPPYTGKTIFRGAKERLFHELSTRSPKEYISQMYRKSQSWLDERESKILKVMLIILSGSIVAMFWYMRHTMRELRQQSQTGSQTSNQGSRGSYQDLIDVGDGTVQVGKIAFDPGAVLGKGCEGTFVFRGTFEKRHVAVKRLLPECFTLADREVALLRESDAHENVVRYFCTEQDRQFRYIAVELCSATLQDLTEGNLEPSIKQNISVMNVLQQATNGLMHLHSLNIVHRDIKPQNVLLSLPNARNEVKAMISDFGLCKKLNHGKSSFSLRSGVTGTEGWIAPEMLKKQRTTTSIDIFSLGCVFYYVITQGGHPFGELVKRQFNILSHQYDLREFREEEEDSKSVLAEELIRDMISKDASSRPTARAVLNHPFFWNADRILSFLQDVSDRVEKIDYSVEPLKTLEKNSKLITRDDWNLHLDPSITSDLRKYRAYQGSSVRDLLRAFRNKKHHYHELTPEMQSHLGKLPTGFTAYWIDRFPRLLSHSYHVMAAHSHEHLFEAYYTEKYTFTKPRYFFEETEDFIPSEPPPKAPRDSPRKFNPNFRFKQGEKYIPSGEAGAYKRANNRGAYNFNFNRGAEAPAEKAEVDEDGFYRVRMRGNRNQNPNNNNDNNGKDANNQKEPVRWILQKKDDK